MKNLSLFSLALLLGACGGGGDGGAAPAPTPTPTPATEAFYLRVMGLVGLAPEDADAADVVAIAASAPEDTEPPEL